MPSVMPLLLLVVDEAKVVSLRGLIVQLSNALEDWQSWQDAWSPTESTGEYAFDNKLWARVFNIAQYTH